MPPARKKDLANGEDLGETRLLRRGRSLQASPGETFPSAGPLDFRVLYCKYGTPGARAGEFLLGADEFLKFADGRVSGTIRRGFSGVSGRA